MEPTILKGICAELKLDPRVAREKLRVVICVNANPHRLDLDWRCLPFPSIPEDELHSGVNGTCEQTASSKLLARLIHENFSGRLADVA